MDALLRDIRYAARTLVRSPGFTLGVVLTLALGIGVNATMFGIVDRLFVRPPEGVQDPGGVRRIYIQRTYRTLGTVAGTGTSFPSFDDLREGTPGFARTAAVRNASLSLGRGAEAERVRVAAVSHDYFPLLGVQAAFGRVFGPDEDRPGGERVAVLSDAYWRSRFGADSGVLGRSLALGKGTYTVIGVGPRGFGGMDLRPVDMWLPIRVAVAEIAVPEALTSRNWSWMSNIARVRPGLADSLVAVQATRAFRAGSEAGGRRDTTAQVILGPIQEARGPAADDEAKVSAWIGAVALVVLLIACANVANLLLARAVARRRELAVRAGLGAGRGGLVRLLLAESLVLATLGGGAALAMAAWGGVAVRSFLLPSLPSDLAVVDTRVLAFTALAIAITALLAGLVPALLSSRTGLTDALKSGGHGTTSRTGRVRSVLLTAQVAMTLVLLVGAGLFVRSLRNVQGRAPGFDADRVLSVIVNLDAIGMSRADANATYQRLLERLERLGGVERAAIAMGTPFGWSYATDVRAEGVDSMPESRSGGPYYNGVTAGYFATMGTPIVRGRDFTTADVAGAGRVVILGERMATMVWPGQDPLGKCLYVGGRDCWRVVGVAADAAHGSVTDDETFQYYLPYEQFDDRRANAIFVRSRTTAAAIADAVRREVQAAGDLPYADVRSLAEEIAPQLRSWRLGAAAFGAFGLLALVIAATGVFAVIAYAVSHRTQEIGVRVALGAQAGDVVRLMLGQGVRAAVAGTVLGAAGAWALGRAIAALLYQVTPTDPTVFVGVAVILLAVAVAAAWLPARRAARVDPMVALRAD